MVSAARLGQAEEADLAGLHELGHRADRLLDRRVLVDTVLVVEVDVIDAEPLQAAVATAAHVLGRAPDRPLRRVGQVAHDAELGGDEHAIAMRRQRLPDQLLVGVRPVHVGRVEERDAEVDGPVDRRDRLRVVARAVEVGHAHAAEPEGGDGNLRRAERAMWEGHGPFWRQSAASPQQLA